MSIAIAAQTPEPPAMDDILEFVAEEPLPEVPWLTKLNLSERRRNVRCLDTGTIIWKRCIDVLVSALGLILLSPLFVVVAVLVKLTSRGPAIYRQTRVGLNLRDYRDRRREQMGPPEPGERRSDTADRRGCFTYGRHFTLYKFRTMRTDAEAAGAQFAQEQDPRITRLGRILRKTRIDELPQLWNVLKGEMTLVGPRPERPVFIKALSDQIPNYLQRLSLKPGVTGVAQVINGYDNDLESFRRKVAFDVLYLQNCSIRNDLKVLLRTFKTVVTGKGAL
jgi:lipopolysaccharide/colanic/teichoic acid biosynthesis glycosyltransferase